MLKTLISALRGSSAVVSVTGDGNIVASTIGSNTTRL